MDPGMKSVRSNDERTNVNQSDGRKGIASCGNWIVDHVKTVDRLPGRGMLASIRTQTRSTGGAPANVLADLARLKAPFPLWGMGLVGHDEEGRYILDRFRDLGIDLSHVHMTSEASTSFTDVMNEEGTGERLFFHHRGANALLGPEHVPLATLSCRIFHLGYLLLLDRLDELDRDFGTVAARVLHDVRAAGIKTSLDVVSEEGDRFKTLVPPALRFVDYLIVNEIEIGNILGVKVRNARGELDGAVLADAVEDLYNYGDMDLIVVHMPEGSYLQDRDGFQFSAGSLILPDRFIVGAVGAGDAFCAGMLFGLHEHWDYSECVRLATGCAAASLSAAGATEGVGSAEDVLRLLDQFPAREAPVTI